MKRCRKRDTQRPGGFRSLKICFNLPKPSTKFLTFGSEHFSKLPHLRRCIIQSYKNYNFLFFFIKVAINLTFVRQCFRIARACRRPLALPSINEAEHWKYIGSGSLSRSIDKQTYLFATNDAIILIGVLIAMISAVFHRYAVWGLLSSTDAQFVSQNDYFRRSNPSAWKNIKSIR